MTDARMATLEEHWVSRASARQRRGRAGRVRPGVAFHLLPKYMFEGPEIAEYTSPEMLRTSLDELVLQILLLDLGEPAAFLARAVDPPLQAALKNSLEFLEALGAVELSGSDGGSGIATAGDDGGGGTGSAKQGKAKEKKEKDRPIARAESWALEGGSGAAAAARPRRASARPR